MIHVLAQRADIMAIQNYLAFQFVPVLLDVIVLDHDNDHIDLGEELFEVEDLVGDDFLSGEEGVKGLQGTS